MVSTKERAHFRLRAVVLFSPDHVKKVTVHHARTRARLMKETARSLGPATKCDVWGFLRFCFLSTQK